MKKRIIIEQLQDHIENMNNLERHIFNLYTATMKHHPVNHEIVGLTNNVHRILIEITSAVVNLVNAIEPTKVLNHDHL